LFKVDEIAITTPSLPCTSISRKYRTSNIKLILLFGFGYSVLGDPGAVSGGKEKSKRARKIFRQRKVKNFSLSCLHFSLPPL